MIRVADWTPIEVQALEPAALDAVKARGSTLVVAGPGAGKTELLAQRAAFLLQTGKCEFPRRILAISFKRDAATNLRDRVARRCGPVLARQLDSMTFDAFAKQLLDRFWRALPERWALSSSYEVGRAQPPRPGYGNFQLTVVGALADTAQPAGWAAAQLGGHPRPVDIHSTSYNDYMLGAQGLCLEPLRASSPAAFLQLVALRQALMQLPAAPTFAHISLLAAAIVTTNPTIRSALCATYSHIFLDEFQDTTSIQYALVRGVFAGSDCVLTAVGDAKQRIMGWAGAKKDVFAAFEADFLGAPGALPRVALTTNYRSNERIVEILNVLKRRLAPDEPDFTAARPAPDLPAEQICSVLVADDQQREAEAVAKLVADAIVAGTKPRAIGLLVRQLANTWEDRLAQAFADRKVGFRNEDRDVGGASIQDLMTEPYSRAILDLIEFCCRRYGGSLWAVALGHFAAIDGIEIDDDESAERALAARVDDFHQKNPIDPADKAVGVDVRTRVAAMETYLGIDRLRNLAPQYAANDFFDRIREATIAFLVECSEATGTWIEAIDRFRGVGQVSLLTITKSKGLEYDLVVLLGLNDDQWWSFQNDTEEGHSVFFVAASRARERLIMTRCRGDGNRKIEEIFGLLSQAGVPEYNT